MRWLRGLCAAVVGVALSAAPAAPAEAGIEIVGGTPVLPGETPYQVSLRDARNNHFYGGTIIAETTIVTAAHCLDGEPDIPRNVVVCVGTLSISGGFRHRVEHGRMHPNYDAGTSMNDVAVLKLIEPVQFNEYARSLPLATESPNAGTQAVVSGWGKTGLTRPASKKLLKADVSVIDQQACREIHGANYYQSAAVHLRRSGYRCVYG